MTEIKHPERMRQLVDFNGTCNLGKIHPTDIDAMLELHDKGYLFYEVKYETIEVPRGQRIALERLVKDTSANGKSCVAIIVQHYVEDTNEPVNLASCVVREIYTSTSRKWREPSEWMTAKQYTEKFYSYLQGRK